MSSYTSKSNCKSNQQDLDAGQDKWTGCVTDRTKDYDTKNTPPTSTNAPTMVVPEEYVDTDWNGNVTEHYCKSGNSPYVGKIVPLSYDWATLKTADRQFGAYRQYQPGHRYGVGLADARCRRGAVQCPGQGHGEL